MSNGKEKEVAIIGAAAAGLPSARWALAYGWKPTIFECQSALGGLWNFKPDDTEFSTVMKSTVINTSKEMTAYSDYPPKPQDANYMHNRKLLQYFRDYATHHDLHKHILYSHRVINVSKAPDYDRTGRWDLQFVDNEGKEHVRTFDAVLTCTGHHATPRMPEAWPGQEKFKGRIVHSKDYKAPQGYEDKTVVVVGVGNSGMDIACELGRISKQVYLSTRRGAWVTTKLVENGYPLDMWLNRRFHEYVKKLAPSWYMPWSFQRRLQKTFDHEKFGIMPKHGVFAQHVTLSDELHGKIASGSIVVKPNIQSFTENGVFFDNGTYVDCEEVVFCTGYYFNFDFLDGGKWIPVKNNKIYLYKNMYPVHGTDHNSNAVIGLVQPLGSIMPIAEIQARLFFAVLEGEVNLPNKEDMTTEMDNYYKSLSQRYVGSDRHTIQVDYVDYMTQIGDLLKCTPQPLSYLFSDPYLCYRMIFHADLPYAYRLRGSHQWNGAREAILGVDERMEKGIKNRDPGVPHSHMNALTLLAAIVSFIAILTLFLH